MSAVAGRIPALRPFLIGAVQSGKAAWRPNAEVKPAP